MLPLDYVTRGRLLDHVTRLPYLDGEQMENRARKFPFPPAVVAQFWGSRSALELQHIAHAIWGMVHDATA